MQKNKYRGKRLTDRESREMFEKEYDRAIDRVVNYHAPKGTWLAKPLVD